jgi:hypothetical protein
MKTTYLASMLSLLAPAVAFADEGIENSGNFDHHVAAPANALELSVAAGYAQGGGPIAGDMVHLEDVASAGGAVELAAAYRINPTFAVGAYGSFSTYATGDQVDGDTNVLGATAGIQGIAHLRPQRSVDPWVSLGTGWRGLWLDPDQGKTTALQGLELARVQVGVDYRVNENIAIAPVVGGSLDMFISQDSAMTDGYSELANKKVNFVGFAGLAGRFDLGGRR